MSWELKRMDEVCSYITDGKHGDCHNQENSGLYFISSKDIYAWRINYDDARQITKDDFDEVHKRTRLEALDVVITNSGTIGRIAVAKDCDETSRTTFQKSVAILKPIQDKVDSHFLAYYLNSQRSSLETQSSGTAQKNLLLKDLRAFKVLTPPIATQKKIAKILSAYDDLIENNLKRIKLLEEAAQNIYKEWFIDFRFPNHENTIFEHGLPKGWAKKTIGDYCKVGRGSSPRPINDQRYFEGGTIPWIKIADATSSNIYLYETKHHVNEFGASFSRKLPIGSLIIAASGTLGFPMFLGVEACIHDGWIYLADLDEEYKLFQFFSFKNLTPFFYSMSSGATIQNINTSIVANAPINFPPKEVVQAFNSFCEPILRQLDNLQRQNQKKRMIYFYRD